MVLVTKKQRPTSIHHKRRHGQHHAQSPDYHKPYWPYLPMAAIVVLGILANTFWGTIQQHVLSYAVNTNISGLLQETNEERVATGLAGLTLNDKLNQAAQAKANDMVARDYWAHNTPDGSPPWVFFSNYGYDYVTAGENLAYGFATSNDTVIGWMNSPGHKANILNGTYKEVGFGIANSPNYQGTGPETIVVAMYGSAKGATAAAPAPTTPAPATKPEPKQATPAPADQAPAPVAEKEANATPTPATEKEEAKPAPVVATKEVSRIQLLSGGAAPWSVFALSAIVTVAIAIFFLRHGLLLRRVLTKGEAFVHKHPFLDIALVAVAVIGIVLTRADGIIR